MRAAGAKYLPKFPMEDKEDWDFRRANAKFTNIFRDIVENLAAKPFTEEAGVGEKSSQRVKELAEDIDGKGNHIHVFAQSTFFNGIAYAIDWILVDYTKNVPENATVADEKRLGVRPYWVHVPAKRVIAVYSDTVSGKEILTCHSVRADKSRDARIVSNRSGPLSSSRPTSKSVSILTSTGVLSLSHMFVRTNACSNVSFRLSAHAWIAELPFCAANAVVMTVKLPV